MSGRHSKAMGKAGPVYDALLETIRTQRWRPGSRILASRVADMLAVSQTPVREALQRLAREGLVVAEAHKGYSIKPFALKDLTDCYEVCEALHLYTINVRIGSFGQDCAFPKEPKAPRSEAEALKRASATAKWIEEIALVLARADDNLEFCDLISVCLHRTHPLRLIELRDPGDAADMVSNLSCWCDSMVAGDAPEATRQMRRYFDLRKAQLPTSVRIANLEAEAAPLP